MSRAHVACPCAEPSAAARRAPAALFPMAPPKISSPGDAAEREADGAADRVMRGERVYIAAARAPPTPRERGPLHPGDSFGASLADVPIGAGQTARADAVVDGDPAAPVPAAMLARKCATCTEEEREAGAEIRRKPTGAVACADRAPPPVAAALRVPGRPLDPAVRAEFEPLFGTSFADVRLHADAAADAAARAIGARAFTFGTHIGFAAGTYAPATRAGRALIAHEIAHVVQQSGFAEGTVQRQSLNVDEIDRLIAENEARVQRGSFGQAELERINAERNALLDQRTALLRGGAPAARPAATATPAAPPSVAPTMIPADYSYRVVGTIPIGPGTGPAAAPAPSGSGDSASPALSVAGGTGSGLGASIPVFLDPMPARGPIPANAPNVYTRFLGPERTEQFFDPSRIGMRGDFRPRLFQSGGIAQQQAFTIFEQQGIRFAQLSQLRQALLSRGVTGLTAEEAILLRQVTEVHARIAGATPASPLISLTDLAPEEALARLPPTATNRAYVVRVQIRPSDVARVNELLPAATETLSGELEVVVARDLLDNARGVRILSVTRNAAPGAPLGGWVGPALTWAGRGMLVIGAGVAVGQVVTAQGPNRREQQGQAAGGFAGGVMLGAFGAGLCVGLGVATAGIGLLACGLGFGLLGSVGGLMLGGAVGRRFDR